MSKPEHQATNKEVRNWGLGAIAASLVAAGTIAAYFSGLWSFAVYAGGQARFATREQVESVVKTVNELDAGTAKKADMDALKDQVSDLKDEVKGSRRDMADLKNLLIRKMGK